MENPNNAPWANDERTQQKVDKHIEDIHDEITEEDINNAQAVFTPNEGSEIPAPSAESSDEVIDENSSRNVKAEEEIKEEKTVKDNKDPDISNTSWNVIE